MSIRRVKTRRQHRLRYSSKSRTRRIAKDEREKNGKNQKTYSQLINGHMSRFIGIAFLWLYKGTLYGSRVLVPPYKREERNKTVGLSMCVFPFKFDGACNITLYVYFPNCLIFGFVCFFLVHLWRLTYACLVWRHALSRKCPSPLEIKKNLTHIEASTQRIKYSLVYPPANYNITRVSERAGDGGRKWAHTFYYTGDLTQCFFDDTIILAVGGDRTINRRKTRNLVFATSSSLVYTPANQQQQLK